MSGYHARLSPSGAHRWTKCWASVVMESTMPNTSTEHSKWGTAVHDISAKHLEDGANLDEFLGKWVAVDDDEFVEVTQEMIDCAKSYVATVRRFQGENPILVEQAVPIDHMTGEAGATGTADCIVIDCSANCLTVIDLKGGMGVQVEAKDNLQLMMYASGALREFGWMGHFEIIEMVIVQPRLFHVSTYTITVEELYAVEDEIRDAATGIAEITALGVEDESFNPGESQCRFCKARATCGAAANQALTAIADDFINLEQNVTTQLATVSERITVCDNDHLARCYEAIPLIKDWINAVEARVRSELFAGNTVPGFKLVEGKRGPRKWTDEAKAKRMLSAAGIKAAQYYEKSVISPTKAEKLLKDHPKWSEISEKVILQSGGSPTIAPESDKRQAIVMDVSGAFADLTLEN